MSNLGHPTVKWLSIPLTIPFATNDVFSSAHQLLQCLRSWARKSKQRVFCLDAVRVAAGWVGAGSRFFPHDSKQLPVPFMLRETLTRHWGNTSLSLAHPPATGGSLVSEYLTSPRREILLQVQTHSSCGVKGRAGKWWVDYSQQMYTHTHTAVS